MCNDRLRQRLALVEAYSSTLASMFRLVRSLSRCRSDALSAVSVAVLAAGDASGVVTVACAVVVGALASPVTVCGSVATLAVASACSVVSSTASVAGCVVVVVLISARAVGVSVTCANAGNAIANAAVAADAMRSFFMRLFSRCRKGGSSLNARTTTRALPVRRRGTSLK